jgi:hypothetical protein
MAMSGVNPLQPSPYPPIKVNSKQTTPWSDGEPAQGVDIDAALVTRLIASQFPQWADLPSKIADTQ